MEKLILAILTISGLLISACAPVNYGPPYSTHSSVSVYHSSVGGGGYHASRKARIDQELYNRHHRVAHIYRGEGQMGDLIEVTIAGGQYYYQGRSWSYRPATFRIASGDIIRFPAAGADIDLFIRYQNGFLALDTDIFGSFSQVVGMRYSPDWRAGRTYRIHDNHFKNAHFKVKALPPAKRHVISDPPVYRLHTPAIKPAKVTGSVYVTKTSNSLAPDHQRPKTYRERDGKKRPQQKDQFTPSNRPAQRKDLSENPDHTLDQHERRKQRLAKEIPSPQVYGTAQPIDNRQVGRQSSLKPGKHASASKSSREGQDRRQSHRGVAIKEKPKKDSRQSKIVERKIKRWEHDEDPIPERMIRFNEQPRKRQNR